MKAEIDLLWAEAKTLEAEVKILEGRLSNRDPKRLAQAQALLDAAKKELQTQAAELSRLFRETLTTKASAEMKSQNDALRQILSDYCRAQQLDPELWKSIAS